jgi:hypothetical protein
MRKNSIGNHLAFNRAKQILSNFHNLGDNEVITVMNDSHHSRRWLLSVVSRARRELKEEKAFLSRAKGV